MPTPVRIAMWSGPRNISTALMRSWGSRADTAVCDEPLYAHYLAATGVDHPGRDEVIAHHETDWRKVVAGLIAPIPHGRDIYYQKHMAHHLLPDIDRDWLASLTHCFLIRDPKEMLTSLIKNIPNPSLDDTGLPQQLELVEWLTRRDQRVPPIIDARDVLESPRAMLERLCEAVGVAFDPAMLSWPPGPRSTDGVWAKHWYGAVEKSIGFEPYRSKNENLSPQHERLLDECNAIYKRLYSARIRSK